MAALVDVDKMSHEDAGKAWLAAHEDVWKPFAEYSVVLLSCNAEGRCRVSYALQYALR